MEQVLPSELDTKYENLHMDKLSMHKFSFSLDNSDNPCERYHTRFGEDHSTNHSTSQEVSSSIFSCNR